MFLTEQTHLFNIFLFFFATIIAGYKMISFSKASHTRRSERSMLVINNGRTDEFILKISKYLEKHMTFDISEIDVKDVKEQKLEKFKDEAAKYSKTILVCKIADRMELYQQEMIQGLDKKIEGLQVFYIINQRSGSHYVDDCKAKQINVVGSEVDEEFIIENFKDYVEMTAEEKWLGKIRVATIMLGALFVISLYGYLQAESSKTSGAREIEELKIKFSQVSQNYIDLLQDRTRISQEIDEMKILLEQSYEKVEELNEKFVETSEDYQNLAKIRADQDMLIKELRNETRSQYLNLSYLADQYRALEKTSMSKHQENEQLLRDLQKILDKYHELGSQHEQTCAEKIRLYKKYLELQGSYDDEVQSNEVLKEEIVRLKKYINDLEDRIQQFNQGLVNQKAETQSKIAKIRDEKEKEMRAVQVIMNENEKNSLECNYAKGRVQVLEERIQSDLFCNLNSNLKDLFSSGSPSAKHQFSAR